MCACLRVLPLQAALRDIGDELRELRRARTIKDAVDELSDIAFAWGRLLGSVVSTVYIPVPGDARHVKKIHARMLEYGCVRSKRHLIDGRCPSAAP